MSLRQICLNLKAGRSCQSSSTLKASSLSPVYSPPANKSSRRYKHAADGPKQVMRSGLGYQLVFRVWDGTLSRAEACPLSKQGPGAGPFGIFHTPVPSLCSLVAAMASTELKLGLSCLGSRATQLGPEPKGLQRQQLATSLNQSGLSQGNVFSS